MCWSVLLLVYLECFEPLFTVEWPYTLFRDSARRRIQFSPRRVLSVSRYDLTVQKNASTCLPVTTGDGLRHLRPLGAKKNSTRSVCLFEQSAVGAEPGRAVRFELG